MNQRKIIFIDFDGVLNTTRNVWNRKHQDLPLSDKYGYLFDPVAVANLAKIIEKTGAEIVVSSSWKMYGLETIRQMWAERNLPYSIADVTPDAVITFDLDSFATADGCVGRGREIALWLENAPINTRYVIVDDVDDMLQVQKTFTVLVDSEVGITEADADRAIAILNR